MTRTSQKQRDILTRLLDEEHNLKRCVKVKELREEAAILSQPFVAEIEKLEKEKQTFDNFINKSIDRLQESKDALLREKRLLVMQPTARVCLLDEMHQDLIELDQKHRDELRDIQERD